MSTTLNLAELYHPIAHPMNGVRQTIQQLWADALRLVKVDLGDTPMVGGKMLRPALCLLSAGAIGGKDLERYVSLAAAFESLHIASLAHDDVIDRALLRRGNLSLNALWDNHSAILGGDYLVARAVEMLAEYDQCAVIKNAIQSVRLMAEGELLFFGRDEDSITQQDCLQLAQQKTASLFAEACSAPAYIINLQPRDTLYQFGLCLGTAFQIIDDILDLTQPAEQLGKPAYADVSEGKITLPLLYLREHLSATDKTRLSQFRDRELSEDERDWLQRMLEQSGALDRAQQVAANFSRDALGHLRHLPSSPYRESLEGILEFLQSRSS